MDNKTVIFSGITLFVGAAVGFIAGYGMSKKKFEEDIKKEEEAREALEEYQKKSAEVVTPETPVVHQTVVKAAKLATPEEPGLNYTAYSKMKAEEKVKAESESPSEEDVEETEDLEPPMETYEERLEREAEEINEQCALYEKKKGDKIEPLGNEPIDNDYPEVHYPAEELYYFTEDDVLTDENGNFVDEKRLIGDKLRRFGWMFNDQEAVWVRNNPMETDYHVNKIKDTRDGWFGV